MNLLRVSAICLVVILASMLGEAREDYGDKEKTKLVTKPTPADLDASTTMMMMKTTTKRRPYGGGKKTTKPPTDERASTAALEMTTTIGELPALETTTLMSGGDLTTTMAPLLTTTTKKRGPKKPKTHPTLPPVDFECKGKRDGNYADQKDKCSNKYYACVGGMARQMSCPPGNVVFEMEGRNGACVNREDSFRCTGVRKTTKSPTPTPAIGRPRPPLPPPEKLPIDCKKIAMDGWFADPEKKCSHIFYSCSGGQGVRHECPGKKYFDEKQSRCCDREEVESCGGKRPPPTTPAAPTTPAPPTTKSPVDCSEKPDGYHPDPENKCSKTYYSCSGGETIPMSCPPGDLYYDPSSKRCDWRDDVFACTGQTKPPPTTTAAPIPSPASLPSKEFNCKGKRNGGYTPEDKKCSQKFFKCIDGIAIKFMCVNNTYYDMEKDKCLRHEELEACLGHKPTPAIFTTVKPKPTEKLPIDCKSKKDGDYVDPEKECSRTYYSCSGMVGTRRICPGRPGRMTFFDKESGICNVRTHVPACSGKPRPTTPRPLPTKQPEKIPFDCTNKKDGWHADDKTKCSSVFYSCLDGRPTREQCAAPGTFFDIGINQCGYREHVPDCGGVRPTAAAAEEEV